MQIPHAIPDAIEVFGKIKKLRKFYFKDDIIHRKSGLGYEVRLILDDETLIIGVSKSKGNLLPVCIEAINGVNPGIVIATFTDGSSCETTFKRCQHSPNDTYLMGTVEASDYIQRARYSASDIKEIAAENLTRPPKDIASDKIETKNTSQALSEKRAKAAKENRTVKDKGDRVKIKAAVRRKEKQGYSSNQAHNEVVGLCKSNENLLDLKKGPYLFISARSVRRIVMNK